jgi:hypothetical protein
MKRRSGSPIVNPRMMRHLTTHFNSIATIGIYEIIYDSFNQPIDQTFTPSPIVALQAILAYKEPLGDQEVAKPNQVVITDRFMVALCGYFPQIRTGDDVRINERVYNITGVTSDDTDTVTFLNVQIVNPIVIEAVN